MQKKCISLILTLAILILTGVVAFATVVSVGGGTWDYCVNHNEGGVCSSRYHHPSVLHGSTVKNGNGKRIDHKISPGKWSNAIIESTVFGNKAYWHRCNIDRVCN